MLSLVIALWCGSGPAPADNGRYIPPRLFGLDLPSGPIEAGEGKTVSTRDEQGNAVTGRVHVCVGDAAVVMLPDGQLAVRKAGDFATTSAKFQPLSIAALADQLVQGEFRGFKVVRTKRHIYLSKSSEEFGLGTSRILDTMVTGVMTYVKGLGIEAREPEFPLVVVIFGSEADFRQHCKVPEGITAYYHTVSNRVYLYEPRELAEKNRELAIRQAISTVAHEGAHQILHNIGVQQRLSVWPMWLSEGLAEYFAPTAFGKNLSWKGAGASNSLRMYELEQYLKIRGEEPPDGRMIEQTVAAWRLTSAGYAAAWGLTHYLASAKKTEFAEFVRQVSKLGPLEANMPSNGSAVVLGQVDEFRKVFGEDLAEMERRMVVHLNRLPYRDPFADLPHFVAMVTVTDKAARMVQRRAEVFPSSVKAERWASRAREEVAAELRDSVLCEFKEFPNRAAAEQFKTQWLKPR